MVVLMRNTIKYKAPTTPTKKNTLFNLISNIEFFKSYTLEKLNNDCFSAVLN